MNLLYLRASHLADRLFVRELATRFPATGQWLIVHEALPTVAATLDAGKRLAWLLSDVLVHNLVFSAGQRNFFRPDGDTFAADVPALQRVMVPVRALIISPVVGEQTVDGLAIARAALALEPAERVVCTQHLQSPLAAADAVIQPGEDVARWLALYEEEARSLEIAQTLAPAKISSPVRWDVTMKG